MGKYGKWNPVKELKVRILNTIHNASAFKWNPVKELKGQ